MSPRQASRERGEGPKAVLGRIRSWERRFARGGVGDEVACDAWWDSANASPPAGFRCHHQRMAPNGGRTTDAAEDGVEMAEKVEREELGVWVNNNYDAVELHLTICFLSMNDRDL
ncbi:hydroxyethylthiazole kinase [Sesbania bispinosa]|nr:hydroxyethylthiazole kinase [Sesbania bispinosa]